MQKQGMNIKWLLIASFLNNFAFGFIWPVATVYLHNELKQSLVIVGWVMLANAVGQAIGSLVSGQLFDRFHPYRLIQGGVIAMIVLQVFFMFQHGWPFYALNLTLAGFLGGWNMALINAYGTRVINHDGRFVFNMLYFTNNFGMVFATAMIGVIFPLGITWLFLLALILYVMLLVVIKQKFNLPFEKQDSHDAAAKEKLSRWNLRLIYTAVFGLVVLWIAYSQWLGNLSVYMTNDLHLPLWQYSLLWTINGVLIVVVQLFMNLLNVSASRTAMWLQIFGGLVMFGLAFLILPFVKTFNGFALAMIITTLGEVTAFPMIPALINELTPSSLKGRYQGIAAAAPSIGRAIGPLLGGIVIEKQGYGLLFFGGSGLVFVAFFILLATMVVGYPKVTNYSTNNE